MNEFSREALEQKVDNANRRFFPEKFADLKHESEPTSYISVPAWKGYANMAGLCMLFYNDKSNSIDERILALDLHRKLLRDSIELGISDGLDLKET